MDLLLLLVQVVVLQVLGYDLCQRLTVPGAASARYASHRAWEWIGPAALGGGRTFAWLNQFRRLRVRYDKRADIHEAYLSLGCALICWQSLRKTWITLSGCQFCSV